MKKLNFIIIAMLLCTTSLAQENTAGWPQMEKFHTYMSASFHPAEENNLAPLKLKADSLYIAAKAWQASPIPSNFKQAETKAALKDLVQQCDHIRMAVRENMSDDHLKKIISSAHDTFHKISGECRKDH